MFRKGSLQDADMVLVYNTASKEYLEIHKAIMKVGIAACSNGHRGIYPAGKMKTGKAAGIVNLNCLRFFFDC